MTAAQFNITADQEWPWRSQGLYYHYYYLWLHWIFVAAPGLSPVAVHWLLVVVASSAEKHRLQKCRLQELHTGSEAVVRGL